MRRLSAAKRAELKALLVKASWLAKTNSELLALQIIWVMAGFGGVDDLRIAAPARFRTGYARVLKR